MSFEIKTETSIAAPSSHVWSVLTDFAAYDAWNPIIKDVRGEMRVGARATAYFAAGSRRVPIPIVFSTLTPNVELAWSGGPKRLFRGRHYFRLSERADGTTRFEHGELFEGIAIPLVQGFLRKQGVPAYQSLTDALKRRCEASAPKPQVPARA